MNIQTSIFPKPADTPRAYMGGTDADIPIVDFDEYGRTHLKFANLDDAVRYLDALIQEVSSLADQIRDRLCDANVDLAAATPTGGA